jgi:hypothetical protein
MDLVLRLGIEYQEGFRWNGSRLLDDICLQQPMEKVLDPSGGTF